MKYFKEHQDIENKDYILDYLGIENENKNEFWNNYKDEIKRVIDISCKYTFELEHIIDYILIGDFKHYNLIKDNEIVDKTENFIIYKDKEEILI